MVPLILGNLYVFQAILLQIPLRRAPSTAGRAMPDALRRQQYSRVDFLEFRAKDLGFGVKDSEFRVYGGVREHSNHIAWDLCA